MPRHKVVNEEDDLVEKLVKFGEILSSQTVKVEALITAICSDDKLRESYVREVNRIQEYRKTTAEKDPKKRRFPTSKRIR